MSFTQTDLDNINQAIVSGVLRVNINGADITYRSLDDLLRVKNQITTFLNQDVKNGAVFQKLGFSKGLC